MPRLLAFARREVPGTGALSDVSVEKSYHDKTQMGPSPYCKALSLVVSACKGGPIHMPYACCLTCFA